MSGDSPGLKKTDKAPKEPLARIVPIAETIDFKNKVIAHHNKT